MLYKTQINIQTQSEDHEYRKRFIKVCAQDFVSDFLFIHLLYFNIVFPTKSYLPNYFWLPIVFYCKNVLQKFKIFCVLSFGPTLAPNSSYNKQKLESKIIAIGTV